MKKTLRLAALLLIFSLSSNFSVFSFGKADNPENTETQEKDVKSEKTEKSENTNKKENPVKTEKNQKSPEEKTNEKSAEKKSDKNSEKNDSKSDKTSPEVKAPKKKILQHDGYLDVNYTLENYFNFKAGLFRAEFFGKTGSFNIYCTNELGKEVPLFSQTNLCTSTGFLLKIDEKIRRLNSESRILKEVRRLENDAGVQLVYTIDNNVRFVIDFSFISSTAEQPQDIIRFRTYTINLGLLAHSVDIKGIFDTIPGESSSVHFVTEKGTKIRNENRFIKEEIHSERSATCTNGTTSFQFIFDGNGIEPIDMISFANIDELYKMDWDATIRKGRGFTNIRAYEDSAIMVDWPSFHLSPDQKVENTIYIAASTNDEKPRGIAYIDHTDIVVKKDEPPKDAKVPEKPVIVKKENPEKRTDVDFIVSPIKDYQLDPEYIQALIDKIGSSLQRT